jgi:hypothetical protein
LHHVSSSGLLQRDCLHFPVPESFFVPDPLHENAKIFVSPDYDHHIFLLVPTSRIWNNPRFRNRFERGDDCYIKLPLRQCCAHRTPERHLYAGRIGMVMCRLRSEFFTSKGIERRNKARWVGILRQNTGDKARTMRPVYAVGMFETRETHFAYPDGPSEQMKWPRIGKNHLIRLRTVWFSTGVILCTNRQLLSKCIT